MYEDSALLAVEDVLHVLLGNLGLTLDDDVVTLNGNNFTGILINEVLSPGLHDVCGELTADSLLQSALLNGDFLSEVEDGEDVLILLVADGTEQRCNRQLLLTVDVSVHDIVDVSSKLNP